MLKLILSGLLILGFLVGCSNMTQEQPKPQVEELILEGHNWKLVSFGRTRMAVPKDAWVSFKEGHYSGNAGCNGMGGKYEIDLVKQTVKFKAGVSTLMACPDMKLETKFRKYLQAVDSYEIRGDVMILKRGDIEILNFLQQ